MSMRNFIEQCRALAAGWSSLAEAAQKDHRPEDADKYQRNADINLELVAKFG